MKNPAIADVKNKITSSGKASSILFSIVAEIIVN